MSLSKATVPPPPILTVDGAEAPRAASLQTTAFAADPVMRWLWPEPHVYLRSLPELVWGFGGRAFASGTAHATADFCGGSLWLPPGVAPHDEALEKLFTDTVPEPRRSAAFSILEQMGAAHPHEPHWHLAFIGVDPSRQRCGIGAALLRHALTEIDERGEPAYLESSNPTNIPLYRRHGFEVIREIRVGGSPVVTPMLRSAR